MAAGSGDGGRGGGGSKIKLKIKACPESPSAPCRRQGAAGGAAAPPPQPPRPGQLSVSLCGCPTGPLPGPPAEGLLLPPVDQRSMGPGGRQGQGEIKGAPRDGPWDGNRDTEMWRQRRRDRRRGAGQRRGDPETAEQSGVQRQRRGPTDRHGDPETQIRSCQPGQSGQKRREGDGTGGGGRDPVPVDPTGQGRGTEMGEAAGRDRETAETVRDGGGSVGAGPGAPIPRLLVITCPEEAAGS